MDRFQELLFGFFGVLGTMVLGGAGYLTKLVLKHEKQLTVLDERTAFIKETVTRMEDKQDAIYLYVISNNPKKDKEPPTSATG